MSMPNSRWNRSTEAASWRSTATSSPVAANARTSSTCASSLSGSAPSRRIASATALCASPAASARNAPSREHGSAERLEPASLAEQPRVEPRARLDSARLPRALGPDRAARRPPRMSPRAAPTRPAVEPLGQPEADRRAAADGLGSSEESPQLREVPPQRVRRVLGLGEQQRRKLLAGRRPLGERQVREHAPRPSCPWAARRRPPRESRAAGRAAVPRWPSRHPAPQARTGQDRHTAPHTPQAYPAARAARRAAAVRQGDTDERTDRQAAANGGSGRGHRAGGRGIRRGPGRAERDDRPAPDGHRAGGQHGRRDRRGPLRTRERSRSRRSRRRPQRAGVRDVRRGRARPVGHASGAAWTPRPSTARAEGGATWGDYNDATHAFGLASTGGIISTTGVGGLTLGGGIGYLSRGLGLSVDNLLSADVVTADGRFLVASERENEDLFWALRGGGGNFGVVTSFEFRLAPVSEIYGGPMFFELDDARAVLQWYREFIADAPEAFGGFPAFQIAPPLPFIPEERHGDTFLAFVSCWAGPVDEGPGDPRVAARGRAGRRRARRADALPRAQRRVRRAVPRRDSSTTGRPTSSPSSPTTRSRRT